MKNYRKLLLEAIQAGNVVGILRGEKRYRIEPPTSVPDVFPTDICQVLTEYFYKQNDINNLQDILEGSLIDLSQRAAVDLYISVLFFDAVLFMQEKNLASFTIHTSRVTQAIAKGIKDYQEELNDSITFPNGLVKIKPMKQLERFNQKYQKNERFSIIVK
ncbi:hypothetical protein [Streptococcus sp. IMAU11622]|uniref:hypothetical protein n=1 Tax=Streptococcus sp. IMAU11622 TaxID=3332597 RepID=UPI0035F3DFE7